jgi:membrane fusion protein, multidrug efflux system
MSALPSRPRFRLFIYGLTVLLIAAGVWYFSRQEKPEGNRWGPSPAWAGQGRSPAMPVRVVPAEKRDLPVFLKAIGTVTPLNTVTVQSRVTGQLLRVVFEEGQRVEKGQLLAEIDPEPYRIRLAQAEGQLGQNQAQLQTAQPTSSGFSSCSTRNS